MMIGTNWAYGHIPKTAGDATAVYLPLLAPGCQQDSTTDPRKHDPFRLRDESHGKQFYLLGIRRLPEWTWSLMHEFNVHPELLRMHGVANAASKEFALSRPFADEYLLSMSMSVTISHWIRQECLLDDLVSFVDRHVRPVSREERAKLRGLPTKPGRSKGNPFTEAEIQKLRDRNPHWSRVEEVMYQ